MTFRKSFSPNPLDQYKPNFAQSNLELAFTFVKMKDHPEIMHIKF